MARATRMKPKLLAEPQKNDDTVKMAMQTIKKRLRPNFSENQLLAGRMMALATR